MATLSSLKNNRLFIIMMGKPLSGKSVLASQFPSPWFIDLDFQLGSINAAKNKMNLDFDFDVTQLNEEETTDEDFVKLCGKATAKQSAWRKTKKLSEVLSRKMPQDSTLILDGLSRSGESLHAHLKKITGHTPLQIQDWGTFLDEMTALCDIFTSPNAKPNVILIAHEAIIQNKVTGAIEKTLYVAGKSAYRLPSLCNEFWYLTQTARKIGGVNKSVRTLQTHGDRMLTAGSRSWMEDVENPTYEKIKPFLENTVGRKLPPPTWTPEEE